MANHINGPLYYERMGRRGPVIAFIHPNPMDQSCWIFQMAHLSTWYRCIAIDIPGYGRSPTADAGLTISDMALACWEAIDETIVHQFKALQQPDPESHHERIACPTIILTGSEDGSHQRAFALQARIPNCELKTLPGAGHACQIEQPWLWDRFMIEFLAKHGLFPGASKPAKAIV